MDFSICCGAKLGACKRLPNALYSARKLSCRYNRRVSKVTEPTVPTVAFISLGCPKNLVDSEVMMGLLDRAGARMTTSPETADVLVVNTCSFIDTAKKESVDTILEMAQHKITGKAQK